MARPTLDEIFGAPPTQARPSLDDIFGMAPAMTPEQQEAANVEAVLERAATPEFKERAARRKAKRELGQEARDVGAYTTGALEGARDYARALAQGALLGFGEEAEAAARTALGGVGAPTYEETLGQIRQEQEIAKMRDPKTMMAGELLGGIAMPGGAAARFVGKGAGLAGRMARGAAVGVPTAAVAGAGAAEGALPERIEAAKEAAPFGLVGAGIPVAGAALGLTGKLAKGTVKAARRAVFGDTPDRLVKEVVSPDKARAYAQEAIDNNQSIVEVALAKGDREVADILKVARTTSAEAADEVENALLRRSEQDIPNITRAINKAVGREAESTIDDLVDKGKSEASKLYSKAYEGPNATIQSQKLNDMVTGEPMVANAIGEARRLYGRELAGLPDSHTKVMDFVKDTLWDTAERAKRQGEMKLSKRANDMRREVVEIIDAQNPAYKEARKRGGDYLSLQSAKEMGEKIRPSTTPKDVRRMVGGMNDNEKKAFQLGFREKILDDAGKTRAGQAAGRVYDRRDKADIIKAVFGDTNEAKGLIRTLESEIAFEKTAKKVLGRSFEELTTTAQQISQRGLREFIADQLVSRMRGVTPKNAQKIVRLMTDPQKGQQFLSHMSQQPKSVQSAVSDTIAEYGRRGAYAGLAEAVQ